MKFWKQYGSFMHKVLNIANLIIHSIAQSAEHGVFSLVWIQHRISELKHSLKLYSMQCIWMNLNKFYIQCRERLNKYVPKVLHYMHNESSEIKPLLYPKKRSKPFPILPPEDPDAHKLKVIEVPLKNVIMCPRHKARQRNSIATWL